jgi:hypothetical protein
MTLNRTLALLIGAVAMVALVMTSLAREPQDQKASAVAEAGSAVEHPILVELFTSEGCSSCPPADALLMRMDETQTIPHGRLIVLSEHVDYWDHQGWRDPHSSAQLTERQEAYRHTLGLETVYTPQMIIDGTHEFVGKDAEKVHVLEAAAMAPKLPVRISELSFQEGSPALLRARVEVDPDAKTHHANVYVALALDHVESQVSGGENVGKHLSHVAVVEQLDKVGTIKKESAFAQDVQLKLKSGMDPANLRVIAFVQEPGPGKVLGAAMRKAQ